MMFGVFFSILVAMALVSICAEVIMRVRLTKREPSRDKLAWWRRGGDQLAATYEEVFPQSRLPLFRRFAFWLVLTWAAVLPFSMLWKSK